MTSSHITIIFHQQNRNKAQIFRWRGKQSIIRFGRYKKKEMQYNDLSHEKKICLN